MKGIFKELRSDLGKDEILEKNISFRYYNYEEMIWLLKDYFKKYDEIVCLYDIGIFV